MSTSDLFLCLGTCISNQSPSITSWNFSNLWVHVKILLVCSDFISWVTGLLHYIAIQIITLLNVCAYVNSCVEVTHAIHKCWFPTHNDDSTVYQISKSNRLFVWLSGVLRSIQEFFTHTERLPLTVKGFKFWPKLGTHGHWRVRVL